MDIRTLFTKIDIWTLLLDRSCKKISYQKIKLIPELAGTSRSCKERKTFRVGRVGSRKHGDGGTGVDQKFTTKFTSWRRMREKLQNFGSGSGSGSNSGWRNSLEKPAGWTSTSTCWTDCYQTPNRVSGSSQLSHCASYGTSRDLENWENG